MKLGSEHTHQWGITTYCVSEDEHNSTKWNCDLGIGYYARTAGVMREFWAKEGHNNICGLEKILPSIFYSVYIKEKFKISDSEILLAKPLD